MGCKSVQPGSTPGRASTYENRGVQGGGSRKTGGELVGRWAAALAALLLCATAFAEPKAAWDGRKPLAIVDDEGTEKLLCGYVNQGKRFWRLFPVPVLIQTVGAPRCPSEAEPSARQEAAF